jgi:hypothetical protein
MWLGGQRHAPAALSPGNELGTHCIGGSVGPRVGQDGRGKSRSLQGFDPQTFQPEASQVAIPTTLFWPLFLKYFFLISWNICVAYK